jgi:uncharacterized protein YoxC
METYPEMNARIVHILRIGEYPAEQYAAIRIEELEQQLEGCQKERDRLLTNTQPLADELARYHALSDRYAAALRNISTSRDGTWVSLYVSIDYCIDTAREALQEGVEDEPDTV